MKTSLLTPLLLLFIVLLTGCSKNDDATIAQESIGLEVQEKSSFSGKTIINGYKIHYKVLSNQEGIYTTEIAIDKKMLEAAVDFTDEHIDFNTNDTALTSEEKNILLALGEEISLYLFQKKTTENFTMSEYTLLRLLEYWGKSPEGYVHHTRKTAPLITDGDVGKKGVDEGIACIRKNTFINAEYDNANGKSIVERVQVNGNRCLGRCGSGCPSFFTLASAWTKDCLDHDRCGRALGGSTNPFDSNCGDEYADAADDYLFGVLRGCSG
ncbi:hypothetical protein [Aquimarina agarivorans]|uniref:hypothetical protein n=1 Tax=Aquimarina agarivorans TaxID=980584 RepID=UPI000248EFCB|nr:hypothetical protein [Aquimarina agarivorans]